MNTPVVLITGALTGIGRATALAFAKEGARIVIAGRRDEAGHNLVAELRRLDAEAEYVNADVRHEDEVRNLVDKAVARFGRIDVAVNNAGTEGKPGPMTEQTAESYAATFDTNVLGTLLSMKHELRVMLAQGHGSIVNVSSTYGRVGGAGAARTGPRQHAVQRPTHAPGPPPAGPGPPPHPSNPRVRPPCRESRLLGPYGVLGTGVVDAAAANPAWRVVTAARRPVPSHRDSTALRHINVDLLDREGTREVLSKLDTVTDLVFAAYVEKPTMAETVEPNARMLQNTLDAFAARDVPLRHVVLAGGAKVYGFSLGSFNAPAKEAQPRLIAPIHYHQQEALLQACPGKTRTARTLLRPPL